MKRAAEKQLIKDDADEEELDEDVGTGFKRADESALAQRPIKGLPKRSLGGAIAPSSTATSETHPAPSKFAGFGGFGSTATSSSPFSFASSSATSNPLKPAPGATSSSPFSFSGSASGQPSSLFGTTVSSSASPATKAFASIVSSSSAPPATPATLTDATSKADEKDKDVEYYKTVRGLNVSLLSALSKAIEANPFVNVADLLERYKAHRVSVDSGRDDKLTSSSSSSASAPMSSELTPKAVESTTKPAPALGFTMPAPPSGFSGFKAPGTTAASSTSSSGSGFVPKIDTGASSTLGSPFSFASFKPAPAESTKSDVPKSAFTFGSSSSSTPSAASSTAPSPFTFGAPSSGSSLFSKPSASSSTSTPSLFGTPAPSTSSFFGSSTFGKPADLAKDKEDDKPENKDPAEPPASASSSTNSFFGSSAAPGPTNLFGTSSPDKSSSANPFSFGSASPSKGTSLFGSAFPKAGSIGNPVGFGFGSPPKTPEAESASGPVKSLPFTFGAPKPATEASGSGEKDAEGGEKEGVSSGDGTPAPDAPQTLPASTSVHDQEGEGEENEVTTHEIRSKVYKMTKDKDGKALWGDLGVGILRLKKDKDSDARRMLLRNSSTGKITINFSLYSGLSASVSDKTVSFIGHDEGRSTPYRIRCKTAVQANDLKAALDREIEFVKEKSGAS
ncbi:hypothetical protein C2E23DRAFT_880472 [Lenzites betulinus]|nr:hypothetical protein C2E23DRAFT_880472 [Lenzites betulinus]